MQQSQIAAKKHIRDLQRATAQVMHRVELLQPVYDLPHAIAERLDRLDQTLAARQECDRTHR